MAPIFEVTADQGNAGAQPWPVAVVSQPPTPPLGSYAYKVVELSAGQSASFTGKCLRVQLIGLFTFSGNTPIARINGGDQIPLSDSKNNETAYELLLNGLISDITIGSDQGLVRAIVKLAQ